MNSNTPTPQKPPDLTTSTLQLLPLVFELGYIILIPIVIFGLAGRWLDLQLNSSPILLLIGILLAVGVSGWLVYRKIKSVTF